MIENLSGIPIPFPFIGYFVFTKKYYVGTLEFVEHGYLAETMCFIRPESVAFYALFLAPIVLVSLFISSEGQLKGNGSITKSLFQYVHWLHLKVNT